MSTPQPDRFIRLPEVLARVEYSKATFYRRVKAGTAPRPVRDGGAARWSAQEIDAWVEGLKSARPEVPK